MSSEIPAQAQFFFELDGLDIAPYLVGSEHKLIRDGREIVLRFPASEHDFGIGPNDFPAALSLVQWTTADDTPLMYSVSLLRVSVDVELPASTLAPQPTKETIDLVLKRLDDASILARQVMRDYISHVRTQSGQYWLGHSGELPKSKLPGIIVDRATGKPFPFAHNDRLILYGHSDVPLTSSQQSEIVEALSRGEEAQVPELLLADAWLGLRTERYRESVLLAAIAAEVKIKTALPVVCLPEFRAVVEMFLDMRREVTTYYHTIPRSVLGRSLHDELR